MAVRHWDDDTASISLRQSVVGGQLSDGKITPPDLLVTSDRIVVLVHGFNVTKEDADRSYDHFVTHLSSDVRAQIVRLYWPGDRAVEGRGLRGKLSAIRSKLAYAVKPETAIESAQALRLLLRRAFEERDYQRRNVPLEICFVAHSLGCRLTIEAIELLLGVPRTSAQLPFTVLMAAAVPQFSVTTGRFRNSISRLRKLWILHSKSDGVLSWVFRPGQWLDTPWHQFRGTAALGRTGIAANEQISVFEGSWGHSDYWRDRDIAIAVDTEISGRRAPGWAFATFERRVWEREVEGRRSEARTLAPLTPIW